MRPWPLALAALAAGLAAPALVSAHPAPSADANNRYVKITPMLDRVRLAYTIYIGEEPGNVVRAALDRDGDWALSEAETATWTQTLAETVRGALALRLDGEDVPVTWSQVVPGLGSARVDGGAFAVDLVAWACTPGAGRRHELDLVDRHALVPPGETEVRIEESPDIRLDVARVGETPFVDRMVQFQRESAPLSRGLHLVWQAGPRAEAMPDDRCPRPPAPGTARGWLVPVVVGGVGLAVLALLARRWRRRPR